MYFLSKLLGLRKLFVLVFLLWAYSPLFSHLQAQHRDIVNENLFVPDEYVVDHWTTDDGLPLNSIIDIIKTKDGYLWFATYDGLIRFNGIDFKIYRSSDHQELKGNRFQQIIEASDGSIIVQTEGLHYAKFRENSFTHLISLNQQLHGNGADKVFYKDEEGTIWMGSDKGVYLYKNGKLESFKPGLIEFPVRKVVYADKHEVWFESQKDFALYRYQKNGAGIIEQVVGNISSSSFVARDGHITWISNSGTLFKYESGRLDTVLASASHIFSHLALNSEQQLIIASDRGMFSFSEKDGLSSINTSQIPSHKKAPFFLKDDGTFWSSNDRELYKNERLIFKSDALLSAYIIDIEGNIWISSTDKGLFRLKPKLFSTYTTHEGLTYDPVYPLFQASDSSIWIGTFGRGINRLHNGKIFSGYSLADENNMEHGFVQSFEELNDSTVLVSIMGKGVQVIRRGSKSLTPYRFNDEYRVKHIFSLFKDSQSRLWIGSAPDDSSGLFLEHSSGEIEKISGNYGVPPAKVRFIQELPNGHIWFATSGNGLIHFDNNEFTVYSSTDGLTSDYPRAIHHTYDPVTENYILWVGYEDKGLDRIELSNGAPDFNTLTNYQTRDGLFDNSIHIIIENNGKFWFNTNRGVFWANIRELEAFHTNEVNHIYTRGYNEADGLLNREGNGGVQPAGFKAFDGTIWFPTQEGVVSFNPDDISTNDFIPPVIIETIHSGELSFNPDSGEIALTSSNRDLTISYASLSFLNSKNNQYKYTLEGYEDSWNLVGERRTAYYTNLPPGTYTFKVQGTNNEGIWNTDGAHVIITIPPYFHETSGFYVLLAFILFSMAFCCKYIMHRRHIKRQRRLQEQVEIRTKELEHEKLKTEKQAKKLAQLNEFQSRFFTNISHELRTPLTLIIGPLEDALGYVGRGNNLNKHQLEMMLRNSKQLHKLINQILDISKYESGAVQLKPEVSPIYSFLKTAVNRFQDICASKDINLEFSGALSHGYVFIDSEQMETVLNNLLSNAVKFTPLGGKIRVHLSEDHDYYSIKITDSGVGIPEQDLDKIFDRYFQAGQETAGSISGSGLGLCIAKEIVDLHDGNIEVTSKEGFGTSFTIKLKKGFSHLVFTELNIAPPLETDEELIQAFAELSGKEEAERVSKTVEEDSEDKTTILVIDDNRDIREYISHSLPHKYRVLQACNGLMGHQMINDNLPDLIVADIMMPGMDGVELNKLLKQNPTTASIPLIFLSAKCDKELRIKRIKEGADLYMTKPFQMGELLANIDNLISSRLRLREQLLNDLIPNTQVQSVKEETDPFLKKLNKILECEFSNPLLSVNMIREKLFMSRSTFYRKIVEKTGINTQQFVNEFRLEKAREMLASQQGSISEISYACGFNSLSYFSRSFKEKFGKSPSEFLKNQNVSEVNLVV